MTMQAQDVMTPWVATIGAGSTVRDAARAMLERQVSALPVVDEKDKVIGIVSEGDLVRRAELGTETTGAWWLVALAQDAARDYQRTHGRTVNEVMSRPVVGVRPTTPVQEIARLLEKHRIKRVPVLQAGRLVGVVSRADLVRLLVTAPPPRESASDRAIRRRVLDAAKKSGVDLLRSNVTVERGVVHLWGGVRTAEDQRALRAAVKAAKGVRKVVVFAQQ
jgi:CBS domain-containing protein